MEINITKIIKDNLKVGMVFQNPGGGTSKIASINDEGIYYQRGKSRMKLKFTDISQTYMKFKDKVVYTNDLKAFNPKVYDSKKNGHSCNCTMLFLLLQKFGIAKGNIKGKGVRGNPFYIEL